MGIALGSMEESDAVRRYYEENRQKYRGDFAQAQRDFREKQAEVNGREEADWQRRVNFSAAVARAKFPLGSEEESRAIRQHYEANRGRFCGDYAAAQREYRAKQGIIL